MKFLAAFAVVLSLAACGGGADNTTAAAPVAAVAPPAGQDWTQTVAKTAEGYVMGNPNAPIKLVEYGARLCPACKAFADAGFRPLTDTYVKSGKVSFEFRDFLIHGPAELGLAVLGQCVDKSAFFPILEQTYTNQDALNQRMVALTPDQQQALQRGAPAQIVTNWTQAVGGIEFMKERGLPEPKARQCLANQKTLDAITAVTQNAGGNGAVTQTPTLIVNDAKVNGTGWPDVEAALKRAGA